MVKHISVLFCYNNFNHIKKCYESLKTSGVDFFVVENKSENSDDILNFFINEKLIGYIQFEENITYKAMEIFIKDYYNLLNEYDYITFTDCDLLLEDSVETFNEIKKNLEFDNVLISCVDLSLNNYPTHINLGYNWIPKPISENQYFIECLTGIHLCTSKKINLSLFLGKFLDSNIAERVYERGGIWVKTKISKAIHLTWDLYFDGNNYYEYKKNTDNIWNHNRVCDYKKIK
jgi:hypothetical protein